MKFLIVYCGHDDSTSANGVCVWNLAKELKGRGHEVWVIWQFQKDVFKEFEKEGIHCYGIRESWFYTFTQWHKIHSSTLADVFYKLVSLLRLFYVIPFYPNVSPWVAMKCSCLANKIVRKNKIERVLGIYMPYDAIKTTVKLKKKYKDNLYVANYHLDLVNSPINTNRLAKSYKLWKGRLAVKQELTTIDRMLLPMSAKNNMKDDKIKYVDFPLFVKNPNCLVSDFVFPSDCINITYIGSLDKSNRNPSFALALLKKCNELTTKKIRVNVWGNLADKETRDVINGFDFVAYHGLVENIYVQDLLSRSDFLLNVSNAVTYNMIPSKIFQQFSMHKPIINIVRHKDDSSLRYFIKYPNVINVHEYYPSENDVQVLLDFLTNNDNQTIKYKDDVYIESTPGYICDLLDNSIL